MRDRHGVTSALAIASALPEVAWPVVPTPAAAGMLAIQHGLARSQWLDGATLEAAQTEQLASLLAHARHSAPLYEMALEGFDLEYGFNRDVFRALPTLTRTTVQRDADGLRCRLLPPDHGEVVEYASSGSTGRPVKVLGTRLHDLWWRALLLRDHFWHGRDFAAKLAVLKTHSTDGTRANWGAATHGVIETGPCVSLNSIQDIASQVRWLVAERPAYVLSHASNLRALAEHCLAQGIRLPDLREARSFGEMLSADLRGLVAAAWEVPVTDSYSAAEVGIIALQCPVSGDLHVQAEHVLVEILRADGHPCLPGEVGRVVVTALHNFAMPLVRYELGDYAEVGAPCPCGRGLPVIKRIVGRQRNLVRLPDGSRHWPSLPARIWGEISPVRQFQLIQTTPAAITVRLVVERALSAAEETALRERLNERLGWSFTYTFEYPATLPQTPGYTDFVCLVDDDG